MTWCHTDRARSGVDRSANTPSGNQAGGLTNIVEKATGSITKIGSRQIDGARSTGEHLAGRRRLFDAATPASDLTCGRLKRAAGMNLHVLTTGRDRPHGLANDVVRFNPAPVT